MENVRYNLYAPDQADRSKAVDTLRLLRTADALDLLIEVYYQDDANTLRYQAIKGIWLQVADGVTNSEEGIQVLRHAESDTDSTIALLARTALADINKVRTSE